MMLHLLRIMTDISNCYKMAVQLNLVVSKALSLNLNFSYLSWISLLLNQAATNCPDHSCGNIVASHLAGPGSIPGRVSFPG